MKKSTASPSDEAIRRVLAQASTLADRAGDDQIEPIHTFFGALAEYPSWESECAVFGLSIDGFLSLESYRSSQPRKLPLSPAVVDLLPRAASVKDLLIKLIEIPQLVAALSRIAGTELAEEDLVGLCSGIERHIPASHLSAVARYSNPPSARIMPERPDSGGEP